MDNKSISKLAAVVTVGAAAGALAWYFMKSENGKQNWLTVVDAIKDVSDKLQKMKTDHADTINTVSEKASEFLTSKATEASEFANNQIEAIASKAAEQVKAHS